MKYGTIVICKYQIYIKSRGEEPWPKTASKFTIDDTLQVQKLSQYKPWYEFMLGAIENTVELFFDVLIRRVVQNDDWTYL